MARLGVLGLLLLLSACSRTTTTPQAVFQHAFGTATAADGVKVINGHLWQNRHLLVFYEEDWRLQLRGPNALQFVKHRWPDLEPARPGYVDNRDTPWFAPEHPDSYLAWDLETGLRGTRHAEQKNKGCVRCLYGPIAHLDRPGLQGAIR